MSARTATGERIIGLHEWALTRESAEDQLHAIELVLAHDFDEPIGAGGGVVARRVREQYVAQATGLAHDERAGTGRMAPPSALAA